MTDGFEVRKEQVKKFYATFSDGFYSPIKKKIKLKKAEKTCAIVDNEICTTKANYTRIICLMCTSCMKMEDVPKYKLSSVPTSLFNKNGDMRLNKQKSELKNVLKNEVLNRHIITEAVVVDGNTVL